MTKPARLIGLIVLLGVALPACGERAEEPASASGSGGERRAAAGSTPAGTALSSSRRAGTEAAARKRRRRPLIDIVRPVHGQRIRGNRVTVKVKVKNSRIVEQRVRPPFPPPVAGRGHVHFYLDTKRLPTRHGPPETGAYRSVSTTTHTWVGVPPGQHSLAVQPVGKDHAPLRGQVKDRITVEVGWPRGKAVTAVLAGRSRDMATRILFLAVTVLALPAAPARASCIPSTGAERFARADTVFVGRVVSVSTNGASARFRVLRVRKGILRKGAVVRVTAEPYPSSTTIDWRPRRGQRWRVYAERQGGRWTIDDCLGTRRA